MSAAVVRLKPIDGPWEVAGEDRYPGVVPESVGTVHNPWGDDTASFQLRRPAAVLQPDLFAYTDVEIEDGGLPIFEGRIWEPSAKQNDPMTIQARGWQYHLDDDLIERSYVHAFLTDWVETNTLLPTAAPTATGFITIETGNGIITATIPRGTAATTSIAGVTLDLKYPDAAVAQIDWVGGGAGAGGAFDASVYASDVDPGSSDALMLAGGTILSSVTTQTTTTTSVLAIPRRYITIMFAINAPVTGSTGTYIKITGIRVYRKSAYASGGDSVFKATDAVRDVLPSAPLLNQDTSRVSQTAFNIPDFAASSPVTPRQVAESANGYHNYRLRVVRERRLQFDPYPTVPLYKVGPASAEKFEQATITTAEDVYNHAIGVAVNPLGRAVRVERWASQLSGVTYDPAATAFNNGTFLANATGWTGTRDTGTFQSSPAALKLAVGGNSYLAAVTSSFSAGWVAGTGYAIQGWVRSDGNSTYGKPPGRAFLFAVYEAATNAVIGRAGVLAGINTWTPFTLVFVPNVAYAAGGLSFGVTASPGTTNNAWIDTLSVSSARPTIVDKRGFVRTKQLDTPAAMTPEALQQALDAFLYAHRRSPLRGTLSVMPGDLEMYLSGDVVHPRALTGAMGEMIHFPFLTDPDTGATGRDGVIQGVGYDAGAETASVTLDSTRDNMDALLARYGVEQGAGATGAGAAGASV